MTRCNAHANLKPASNSLYYCKRHWQEVEGREVRRETLPRDDLVLGAHPTKRKRFTSKQPPRVVTQLRPACRWPAGCEGIGRLYLEGQWFCKLHAAWICSETAAVLSLTDYKDALVDTHRGSSLGGNNLEDKCGSCGAYNFHEERAGTTEHFNMCLPERKGVLPEKEPR